MLKLLRKKKVAKRIFYILSALIIPAFVVWGSASVLNKDKGPNSAGTMFGKKVSYEDFRHAMNAWKMQIRLQYGEDGEKGLGTLFDPIEGAWDRLILLHEVKKRQIRVSDKELVALITSLPFLQKDGVFSNQNYDLFLQYSVGMPARQFEDQMRQNLQMASLYKEITAGVSVSDDEVRKEYEKQFVQTKIKYVLFSPADNRKDLLVAEEEIKQAYDKSKEKFKVPPQINVLYVTMDFKEGMTPEEEKKAEETMKGILKGARSSDLKQAAAKAGLEVKETGFFGFDDPVPGLGWMPQLKNLLFDTPQGKLTDVVVTDRGIYLFNILEKKKDYIPEFKEAKTRIREVLMEEKASQTALKKATDFLNKVQKPSEPMEQKPDKKNKKKAKPAAPVSVSAFDRAAQAEGLPVKESGAFSRTSYISELGMADDLKNAAFTLKKGGVYSKVVVVSQGFCVIQALDTPVLNEEKFNKEKEDFKKALLEQKRNEAFSKFFTSLKKEAQVESFVKPLRQVPPAGAS